MGCCWLLPLVPFRRRYFFDDDDNEEDDEDDEEEEEDDDDEEDDEDDDGIRLVPALSSISFELANCLINLHSKD
jgi:hypothetical protein